MKRLLPVFIGVVATMTLISCAAEVSRVDADFGTSYKLAKANQTLNPDADRNLDPVTGISGDVGKKVIDKYAQGFEKAIAAPTYIFQVGTGK